MEPVKVRIRNAEYLVQGEDNEQQVQRIADYVNDKLKEIEQSAEGLSEKRTAILAALDIAGDYFQLEVGCYPEVHPQAKSPEADLQAYVTKVRAGANSAITQYFYNSDAYFRFVDDAYKLGADIPVVPGIMPIISSTQLMRFSDACGAEIPRWIRLRLQAFGDDTASIKAFGLDVVSDLCEQLLNGGAPGLHFYTMNQSQAVKQLVERISVRQN